jgi:hypothetical protein
MYLIILIFLDNNELYDNVFSNKKIHDDELVSIKWGLLTDLLINILKDNLKPTCSRTELAVKSPMFLSNMIMTRRTSNGF